LSESSIRRLAGSNKAGGQSQRYRLAGGIANRMSKLPFDYQGEFGQRR
jgi:hypothetical protein